MCASDFVQSATPAAAGRSTAAGRSAAGPSADIPAPIDPPHRLTSSFGEYRRGHFHGGVDFSTGQKTGLPVRAVADGRIWRVRASGSGYGLALYVRLVDGRTAVYAHLDAFNPAITAYVEAAQESLSRYEVDLYPGVNELPVAAGAILGTTGESGAGPPHLHFEIREGTGADTGVNPLRIGLAVADTTAPLIKALQFRPAGEGSRINGQAGPVVLPVVDRGRDRYTFPGVTIEGEALLSVRAWDPTTTGNRLAPYTAVIEAGGQTLYAMRLDRFDWNSAHQVELVFDAAQAGGGDSFYMNLYRPEGATNPAFEPGPPLAGRLDAAVFPSGAGDVTIRVRDAAGNEARLDGTVTVQPAPAVAEPDPAGVFRVSRGNAMTLAGGRLTLSAPDRAFFGPGRVRIAEAPVAAGDNSGLVLAGGGVAVNAPDLVLDRAVRVALAPTGADSGGSALYRVSGSGSFSFVGDASGPDGIGGETRSLGTFVLARDVSPPSIRILSPRAEGSESGRPSIRVTITDRGSGFGWSDITTEIDGITQIVVFDPESARLSGRSRRALAPGEHTLLVRVRDRAGNTSVATRVFRVAG